jgi:hypothetical protein
MFKQQGTGCGMGQLGEGEVQMAVACRKVIGSKKLRISRLAKKILLITDRCVSGCLPIFMYRRMMTDIFAGVKHCVQLG